jgi:hypothetical protein
VDEVEEGQVSEEKITPCMHTTRAHTTHVAVQLATHVSLGGKRYAGV